MDIEQSEYYRSQQNITMAYAALVLGAASVFTILTVYLPLIFGSLAVILAVLSKGYARKMMMTAKIGFISAISSLTVILSVLLLSIMTFITLLTTMSASQLISFGRNADSQIEQQLGESPEDMFGISYEDMMQQCVDLLQKK